MSMPNGDATTTELVPTKFLVEGQDVRSDTALIVLNSPISNFKSFKLLYENAAFRIAADGGANRIHDLLLHNHPQSDWKEALRTALPDAIHGDLDSLKPSVRERYDALGVLISHDPDQYSTDFGKSVKKVMEKLPEVTDVLMIGSLGGRVDQGIGLLHEMFREQKHRHPTVRFWLFSETSITTLIHPGTTRIRTPLSEGILGRAVGILPLFGRASISTKGLQWDVEDWPTKMGGQVSTSNYIVDDWITITADNDLMFTVQQGLC